MTTAENGTDGNIERVGVVGCGLMGSRIAEVCARAGLDAVVREVNQGALDAGRKRIEQDELLRLSGLASLADLDDEARLLYDDRGAAFSRRFLAAAFTPARRARSHRARRLRAVIRNHAESVDRKLPANPAKPSELRPSLSELFPHRG